MRQFFKEVFVQCWPLSDTCAVNWDAWGVTATGIVGGITVFVAVLAWKTSRQAAEIAANQHQVAVQQRYGRARIIGRLLLHEVTALTAKVESYEAEVKALFDEHHSPRLGWKKVRETLRRLQRPLLPSAETMIESLHNLPDWLGADLATMISHSRDINDIVRRILDQIHEHAPPTNTGGYGVTYSYSGEKVLIASLISQLNFVAKNSLEFVSEFRAEVLTKAMSAEEYFQKAKA